MTNRATLLPTRRPDLVSWPACADGAYLVRNRASGETFQLGSEEHFLLERLDGRQSREEMCSAFAERFDQPLAEEDFDVFVRLAADRGLLLADDENDIRAKCAVLRDLNSAHSVPVEIVGRSIGKRAASRLLKGTSSLLRWPARILGAAATRLDVFRLKRLDFTPRADDIFIVTYPRSGTTWMQMILYQLTSDGRMDFPHIAEYCPWFERSGRSARGFELRPSPRLFKSHLPYSKIPKGPGKYIYVARDGKDVAVSYYHLSRSYNGYEGSFAEFFARFLRGKVEFGSWFRHVRSWWAHRNDPNVLFLTYGELKSDLEACVRRIVAFCGLEASPQRFSRALERSRFAFMKRHESQFDPALETLWEDGVKLSSFLRNGQNGEGAIQLNREQEERFEKMFRRFVSSSFS